VSCTSTSFCLGVSGSGRAAIYNGSTWSTPISINLGSVDLLSCVSESFCMVINGGYSVTYNGSTWSAPTQVDGEGNPGLSSLSCGSASFCVTVGNYGDEVTYNAGTWSKPTQVGHEGTIRSVSCYSESFCLAMSGGGETVMYKSGTWSSSGHISLDVASGAVACVSESLCLAVGDYAATYNGSSWSSAVPVGGGGLRSVSCASSSFCAAVDLHGRALSYNGYSWSAPSEIDAQGHLNSISCPSASFCAAVGGYAHGSALTYNGTTWGTPVEVDAEGGLVSVSCLSASFCMAVAEQTPNVHSRGYALTYNGSSWSTPSQIDPEVALRSVSCASEEFCVAVGGHDAVTYKSGSWSTPSQVDPEGFLEGVSCTSSSFCVAVGEHFFIGFTYGQGLVYNGLAWSAPAQIPHAPYSLGSGAGSVSCVSPSFCLAAARFQGEAAIFEGGTWNAWTPLEVNGSFSSVSCPSVSFCMVVALPGQAFTYLNPTAFATSSSNGGGTAIGGAPTAGSTATGGALGFASPRLKGAPRVNHHTGEITLEYEFPEPGEGEAYGEVHGRAVLSRALASRTRCKKGFVPKGKKCVGNAPLRFGRARLVVHTAGRYRLHIKPSTRILRALQKGKTLSVRVTLVFAPANTAAHIRETTSVRVRLSRVRQRRR
jgi:hypothetical protein